VYTQEASQPWAEAVAIQGQQILAVGSTPSTLALAGPNTALVDLRGRLLLPGLCDAHLHLSQYALGLHRVQLASTRSRAEMLERIAAAAAQPGDWIVGHGWNESWWGESHLPSAAELDSVTGLERPALFYRSDLHSAVANSAALRVAGLTAQPAAPADPLLDRTPNGQPTGLLREQAIDRVARWIPLPSPAEQDAALAAAFATLHRLGITALHAQRLKEGDDGPREWSSLLRLRQTGNLLQRVACNVAAHDLPHLAALGLRAGFGDDYLRLGHVKIFADGSLGSRTAWMLAPFVKLEPAEPDNCGVCVTPPAQMAAEFRRALDLGFPISVHAIGDRANQAVLEIFAELAGSAAAPPIPHRIEHAQTLDPADLPRLAQLGITASLQPIHALDDMDTADRFLGERADRLYKFRSLHAAGTLLAFGSDAPVADPNPFAGIHAALVRQRPERLPAPPWYGAERISLAQAIEAYTLGPAHAAGWAATIGSIAPGKRADLVVVDRNLFELTDAEIALGAIAQTQVQLTLFDGRIVYRAPDQTSSA
jgi:predicted amidohydrolase YtcJ